MSRLYYRHEFVAKLKTMLSDAIKKEIDTFADNDSDSGNIALRHRITGMYNLISFVEKKLEEEDRDEES